MWTFVFFGILGGDNQPMLIVGIVLGLMAHSFMYGPQAAFIVEQFSPRLRSTGSSLAYTFAGVIGGAIAPLMFTLLLSQFGTWIPVAIYVAVAGAVTLVGLALGRDSNTVEDEDYRLLLEGTGTADRAAGVGEIPLMRTRSSGAEQEVPGHRKVMVDGLLRQCGVAGHQGIEDVLVFGAHRLAASTGPEQGGDAHQDLAHVELAVGAGDELIARSVDQLLMEERVKPDELAGVGGLAVLRDLGLQVKGLLHQLLRNPLFGDHQAGRVALQDTAQFHQFGNLPAGDGRNVGTPLRDEFHQAVGDQEQQRFPDGGAGDADLGSEFLLIEEAALEFRIGQYVFAQMRVGLFPPRRGQTRHFSHTLCIQQIGAIHAPCSRTDHHR